MKTHWPVTTGKGKELTALRNVLEKKMQGEPGSCSLKAAVM